MNLISGIFSTLNPKTDRETVTNKLKANSL